MNGNPKSSNVIRTAEQQRVEQRHGAPIEALLRRLYVQQGLTQQQVAETLGVSPRSVTRWMVTYGIPTRDRRALAMTA